jgi:hypothetical protein
MKIFQSEIFNRPFVNEDECYFVRVYFSSYIYEEVYNSDCKSERERHKSRQTMNFQSLISSKSASKSYAGSKHQKISW